MTESAADNTLMTTINASLPLLPAIQDSSIVTATAANTVVNPVVSVSPHNSLQVTTSEVATAIQALAQDPIAMQQQVQQVEQVVAQAQQQVEQVN